MAKESTYKKARFELEEWQQELQQNPYLKDKDFQHSVAFYFNNPSLEKELIEFADKIKELDSLVIENNFRFNLPRLENFNAIGQRIEHVKHHPTYEQAGNIIYGSKLLERFSKRGGISQALAFFFLSSQAGEAGHNCPIACSAGLIRVLQKTTTVKEADYYIKKLIEPSFSNNYTAAQFLTEVQGGSDVAKNATYAFQDEEGHWRIRGEKWFCSNANADLILLTARFNEAIEGTKGLALFLVPKTLENKKHNFYKLRRIKEKIGTCSMASAEIDFEDAYALPVGELKEGFKLVMENVLHISRLFNSISVLGMARRAYYIALYYAKMREAFGTTILHYPLIQENLARIKTENSAAIASIFATSFLQDQEDKGLLVQDKSKLLLRLLANLNKYISAYWTVEHIHHALDVLAGNGAIETFSIIPRLLRDSIVCENWEGTHNVLRMQILRDIHKFEIDKLFFDYVEKEINKIEDKERKKILYEYLQKTQHLCEKLKASELELQSLMIKEVVYQMSLLFLAMNLLIEALHQQQTTGILSKLTCFDYFNLLHLQPKPVTLNEKYLNLIEKIVAG